MPDGSEGWAESRSGERIKKAAKKRKRLNKLKLGLYIVIIISAVAFFMFAPVLYIDNIECVGNSVVSEEQIRLNSGLTMKDNYFRTSIKPDSKLAQNIAKLPYVKTVELSKKFPDKLVVTITENAPAAYLPYMNNYLYVDEVGKALEIATAAPYPKKPVIKGVELKNELTPGQSVYYDVKSYKQQDENLAAAELQNKKLKYAITLLNSFIEGDLLRQVQQIDIDNDLECEFIYNSNLTVKLGSIDNLDYKISLFKRILGNVKSNVTKSYLDLSSGKEGIYSEE